MANLEFTDKHNIVAYLEKSEGSEGFHEIIDFLNGSHIKTNGEVELIVTIDRHVKTITEAFLRRHLKLEDNDGVTSLPNSDIFEQLTLMGYATDLDKLTFQKVLHQHLNHNTQPLPAAKEHVPTPHESPLYSVHSHGSDEEDSSKQGRKISDIDEDPNISLILATGKDGVNTASGLISTVDVSTVSEIDTAAAEKANEKGKGIMTEPEPPKKLKKRVQVQLTVDEELDKKLFEEEKARFNAEQGARAKEEQEQEKSDFKKTHDEELLRVNKLVEEEASDYEEEKGRTNECG
ncbi:hypothetical protein Tco_1000342 [Tanacetum coccineum]